MRASLSLSPYRISAHGEKERVRYIRYSNKSAKACGEKPSRRIPKQAPPKQTHDDLPIRALQAHEAVPGYEVGPGKPETRLQAFPRRSTLRGRKFKKKAACWWVYLTITLLFFPFIFARSLVDQPTPYYYFLLWEKSAQNCRK